MGTDRDYTRYVVDNTIVLRSPRQSLSTFGITNVRYFVLTEPAYAGLIDEGADNDKQETVVREGRVIAERPRIVTPRYLMGLFQGFEHGHDYLDYLTQAYGPNIPGLLYSYRNQFEELTIVSDSLPVVAERLKERLESEGDSLGTIIKGVDEMWDVSLLKFIYELTNSSVRHNASEMAREGLFAQDERGLPLEARQRIEKLFAEVAQGNAAPARLKAELDRWGVFADYEDRFLGLFRRRQ